MIIQRQEHGETMETVSVRNGEHYFWGKACEGWHLLKSPGLSVIQERVPPGGAEARHFHERARQFFFVLAGEAVMELDGERVVLGPQQGVEVPPRVPHRLLNEGQGDLSFLVVSAPMSHGDRVQAG
jgi:mannose-6-phosphate isomerase-like protein (cupin superfamily)